uniref:T26-10p n=1 Tax=Thermococcus sp. 26/2 TaxID=758583 RepID=D6MY33_9EURY|nr:t26-10p [Thermococcus sp. 26/2]
MRKKERQLITIGLVVLFAAIAWWAYNGHASPGVVLNLGDNSTNTTETYQLAVSDLSATVDQATGHVLVAFKLTNEEHFNISSVQVLHALNVADPNNATYTALNATAENGTYKAEIPSKFGDAVYYKVKVVYDGNKTLESEVQSITVKDTTAPTLNSVSIDYNSTALTFAISFNATDNDQIAKYYVYWADLGTSNTVSNTTTFTAINATTSPVTIANLTEGNYYAFYFKVEDLSGNKAMLYNETAPLVIQANSSATWPQVYPEAVNQSSS